MKRVWFFIGFALFLHGSHDMVLAIETMLLPDLTFFGWNMGLLGLDVLVAAVGFQIMFANREGK